MIKLERPSEKSNPDAVLSDEELRELAKLEFDPDHSLLERWLELAETALKKHSRKQPERPD
jgi:hypothetical protein